MAVATLWLLYVRGVAEETIPVSTRLDVTATLDRQRRSRGATRLRLVSIVHRGWIIILVALLDHAPPPRGSLLPEPWPATPVGDLRTVVPALEAPHVIT